jgi:hypothetical protein
MFVFVLGDPLSQYLRSHTGGSNGGGLKPTDVAVRWDGGKLTNSELAQLVMQRRILNGFIGQVEAIGRRAAIEAGGEPQPLRVEPIVGPERLEDGVESDVVRTRIFADAAEKIGMAVSDEHLIHYLEELGRGLVSVDQIRMLLENFQIGGRRTTIDVVLDALRQEMLARNYLASYRFAFSTSLPEQRWQDWLNVNDRVVVEAAAFPAESLLADVPEPTEDELVAFFDEYRTHEPQPVFVMNTELPSPNPGFRVPRKVAVQYLLADFNQFLAKMEDEITEDEIKKFYEDNKDPAFVRAESVLSEADEEVEDSAADENSKSDESTDSHDSAGEGATSAPGASDESSDASWRESPFRLTALAEDNSAGGDVAEEPAVAETAEEPTVDAPTAELDQPTERPKQFQPLDEVRDEIRRQLAQLKVSEQLTELMAMLEGQLDERYTEYFGAAMSAEAEGKQAPAPPKELTDLTPLAEANKLIYQKTEPATWQQLRDTSIGSSSRPDWGNVPFYLAVFARDVEPYQPILTYDLDANRYLAMKIEDIPGRVPALDEVRAEVVRAWKLRKASELALQRAEEWAKKVQATGASLQDTFADDRSVNVIKTDPFAYLTIGSVSRDTQQVQSFRLSAPDGIVAAGTAFMEEVFGLQDGEAGAALNHDHSIAYVVRIVEHQESPAELRQAFLSEADTWYGVMSMTRDRSQFSRALVLSEMLKAAGIQEERPLDQPLSDDEQLDES